MAPNVLPERLVCLRAISFTMFLRCFSCNTSVQEHPTEFFTFVIEQTEHQIFV
jgi:hypothetical protein